MVAPDGCSAVARGFPGHFLLSLLRLRIRGNALTMHQPIIESDKKITIVPQYFDTSDINSRRANPRNVRGHY